MPASFRRSRSTRRTATVTHSAPEASMADTISSLLRYLPGPTNSRDRKALPAMTSGWSSTVSVPLTTSRMSAPSDEMHHLDGVSVPHRCLRELGAPDDVPVELDHHGARIEPEQADQLPQRSGSSQTKRLRAP